MDPDTVNNLSASFELRSAGPNEQFDDDDVLIPLRTRRNAYDYNFDGKRDDQMYLIGTNQLTFELPTLANGSYRFVATSHLTNPFGVSLDGNGDGTPGDHYVHQFFVSDSQVPVDEVMVTRGVLLNTASEQILETCDNRKIVIQEGFQLNSTEAPVEMEFEGTSPSTDPSTLSTLSLQLVSRGSTLGLVQSIELFNNTTREYEIVDQRPVSRSDAMTNLSIADIPERFINLTNGEIRAKFSVRVPFFALSSPWNVAIDHAGWVVD